MSLDNKVMLRLIRLISSLKGDLMGPNDRESADLEGISRSCCSKEGLKGNDSYMKGLYKKTISPLVKGRILCCERPRLSLKANKKVWIAKCKVQDGKKISIVMRIVGHNEKFKPRVPMCKVTKVTKGDKATTDKE